MRGFGNKNHNHTLKFEKKATESQHLRRGRRWWFRLWFWRPKTEEIVRCPPLLPSCSLRIRKSELWPVGFKLRGAEMDRIPAMESGAYATKALRTTGFCFLMNNLFHFFYWDCKVDIKWHAVEINYINWQFLKGCGSHASQGTASTADFNHGRSFLLKFDGSNQFGDKNIISLVIFLGFF